MSEFIAITDDLFYAHPEIYFNLIPYHVDRPCRRLLKSPLDKPWYEKTARGTKGKNCGETAK